MNKQELVRAISEATGYRYTVIENILQELCCTVSEELAAGNQVRLAGFGVFEVRDRAPRVGRDPHTGNPIPIPSRKSPVFKPSDNLRKAVNSEEE